MARILLVEDNEMNRDMLARRLGRRGFEVLIAVDGEVGVTMARSEKPELVLMDMSLPVLDGWEATRQLKADPATASLPVIALTAHAMTGDREKAMRAGCDDYDTKPVDFPRLLGKIEALLARSPAGTAPLSPPVLPTREAGTGAGSETSPPPPIAASPSPRTPSTRSVEGSAESPERSGAVPPAAAEPPGPSLLGPDSASVVGAPKSLPRRPPVASAGAPPPPPPPPRPRAAERAPWWRRLWPF